MKSFVREKKIYCGDTYLEVDIYPYVKIQEKGKRAKKKKESLPKQKNLNDKNARRKFVQLVETNFGENDLAVHLTYSDETLPGNIEEAEKEKKKGRAGGIKIHSCNSPRRKERYRGSSENTPPYPNEWRTRQRRNRGPMEEA